MTTKKQEMIFLEWLGDYKRLIFKVVRAYAADREDQNDLFQEILLGLWASIPNYQQKAKETTWIYRVALNTALVWTRNETRRRKRNIEMKAYLERIAETASENPDGNESDRIIEQVYCAIRKLPKIDGSVILMWLDNLSYEQMAEVTGISKSNVGAKLNRARKRLAALLKGLIDDI